MTAGDGERGVDDVDVATAWEQLSSSPRSQLVDVRTRAEWTYVGTPDLGSVGKRTVLVEWQTFPDQTVDPRFAERLAGELKALGVEPNDDLYLHLPFGEPQPGCGKAMTAAGYTACHNVAAGFEGPLDEDRHRGAVGGWKASGLPWLQG